ncbi:hypothetical protein K2C01_003848 [Vibrio vulnificus]|nr:hypothetical protein [Vibrio vulnificus]
MRASVTPIGDYANPKVVTRHSGGGDDLEARVARLESDVEYIKRDISEIKTDIKDMRKESRTEFYILISFMIGLLGVMAKGFGWL